MTEQSTSAPREPQLRRHRRLGAFFVVALILIASTTSPARSVRGDLVIDIGRGPVTITVPNSYVPGSPLPLVLVLHGYGGNGASMANWWQMPSRAEEYGFFVAHPEGTVDDLGNRFWNATDACCNFFGSSVDDSQYLLDFIDEVRSQVDVDPDRVYVCGHSNGGFMSHRMACDHPETVAAIGSLAGVVWDDPFACDPGSPVHVLQIHGTADSVIFYDGGNIGGIPYPGAIETAEYWAGTDGCFLVPDTSAPPLDLVASLPGAETSISRYAEACDVNGSAELWTIAGGPHSPNFNATFSQVLVEYLLAHPKSVPASSDEPDASLETGILSCAPSPFTSTTSIELRLTQSSRVSIQLVSADGRIVETISEGEVLSAGQHEFHWDGRNRSGRDLAAGVYFVRALVGGVTHEARVVQLAR